MEAIGSGAGEMKLQLPLLRRQLSFVPHGDIQDSLRLTINELRYDNKLKSAYYRKNLRIQALFSKKFEHFMEYLSKMQVYFR